jgi:hypothetical protein
VAPFVVGGRPEARDVGATRRVLGAPMRFTPFGSEELDERQVALDLCKQRR